MLYHFRDFKIANRVIRYIRPDSAVVNSAKELIKHLQDEDENLIAVMDYRGIVFHLFRTPEEAKLWEHVERNMPPWPNNQWSSATCEI